MAKISISIPDKLKDQLDTYARDTGFKRSEAVAHVLELFFADQLQSPAPIDPVRVADLEADLSTIRNYLTTLHELNPERFPRPSWVEVVTLPSFIRRRE